MYRHDISSLSRFFKPLERSKRIHRNFIFRFGYCGLGEQKAAELVGVDLEQIYRWDDGCEIPLSVRKVWLYESGRELPGYCGFEGWSFRSGYIIQPSGSSYTLNELNHALYLLSLDRTMSRHITK